MSGSGAPGLLLVVSGALIVALSVPLARRRVAMNSLYGIRFAKSYASEADWYAINAYGGRVMAVAGAVIALIGVLALVRPPETIASRVLLLSSPAVVLLVALIPIVRFVRRQG